MVSASSTSTLGPSRSTRSRESTDPAAAAAAAAAAAKKKKLPLAKKTKKTKTHDSLQVIFDAPATPGPHYLRKLRVISA
jgi:hypothetical protein